MTCIVALKRGDGRVIMGADSRITGASGNYSEVSRPKLWRIMGGAGAVAVCGMMNWFDMVRYEVAFPETVPEDVERWTCVTLVKEIRELFQARNVNPYRDEKNEPSGSLVIGVAGRIFEFFSNTMCASEVSAEFTTSGSGWEIASGSLATTALQGELPQLALDPESRVRLALEASARCRFDCAPPFQIIEV